MINELSAQIAAKSGVTNFIEFVPTVGDLLGPAKLKVVSVGTEDQSYRVFNDETGAGVFIPGGTVLAYGGGIFYKLTDGNLVNFHPDLTE